MLCIKKDTERFSERTVDANLILEKMCTVCSKLLLLLTKFKTFFAQFTKRNLFFASFFCKHEESKKKIS